MKKFIVIILICTFSSTSFSNILNERFNINEDALPGSQVKKPTLISTKSGQSAEYEICIEDCEADCYDDLVEALYIDSISIFSPTVEFREFQYEQCLVQCEDRCAYLE